MEQAKESLQDGVKGLLRKSEDELRSFFDEIEVNVEVDDTKAVAHCYVLKLDGNGVPPVDALVDFLTSNATEFALSRAKIAEAEAYQARNNSPRKVASLVKEARGLFMAGEQRSGEGGELLLYLMAQEFLKLPQLLSKMSFKMNTEIPVHGTDGIHVAIENDEAGEPILCLYWCESKLHKTPGSAIGECIDDLSTYVLVDGQAERRERDLQLAHDHLAESVNNEALEKALIRYLKKGDPLANRVNFRGIGLVGFDSEHYPSVQNTVDMQTVKDAVNAELKGWIQNAQAKIKDKKVHTIVLHLFIIPLPSVEKFREKLKAELSK